VSAALQAGQLVVMPLSPGGDIMAIVCLSVCLSICLSVRLSVCPVPDLKSRTERRSKLKIGRKQEARK